jgi:hypothetical protein
MLHFVSVSRFDQQNPTRPHRDGGPDASILLLGYEPTEVKSRLSLLDYTRAAVDRDMTPAAFLDCCNPAFGGDPELLRDYIIPVEGFDSEQFQILIVNNSQLPYEQRERGMLGLLHHAVVDTPLPGRERCIDSLLMGVVETGLSEEQLRAFIEEAKAAST